MGLNRPLRLRRVVLRSTRIAACLVLFPAMFAYFLLAEPTGWVIDRLWNVFSGERND